VAFHPSNIAKLDQALDHLSVEYKYEFYDSEKRVVLERKYP
jgi:hypothetical protein